MLRTQILTHIFGRGTLLHIQNNPLSEKIGLSFHKDNNQSTMLYSQNQASLQYMRNYLSKYLNQKGFHNQFKAVRKLGKGNFASVYEVCHL